MSRINMTEGDFGCYFDGNQGQYQGISIATMVDEQLGTNYMARWPKDDTGKDLGLYGESGSPWAALYGDVSAELATEIMLEAVCYLNEHTDGPGLWDWHDGDFGYYESDEDDGPF